LLDHAFGSGEACAALTERCRDERPKINPIVRKGKNSFSGVPKRLPNTKPSAPINTPILMVSQKGPNDIADSVDEYPASQEHRPVYNLSEPRRYRANQS
jgi:hypothetical protein